MVWTNSFDNEALFVELVNQVLNRRAQSRLDAEDASARDKKQRAAANRWPLKSYVVLPAVLLLHLIFIRSKRGFLILVELLPIRVFGWSLRYAGLKHLPSHLHEAMMHSPSISASPIAHPRVHHQLLEHALAQDDSSAH
eukprot:CAMPEP_0178393884 /NCGR_PEP_ID=MMETSP0689_2-20121128/12415_1 /TAXON_ID=160604 /ORGANISM="Amphidinium massartii, Strain CS-259" /LENGTH=138 /DNA_ID=CAMNT_0020014485 /DNA_START=517 /DNA_END=930 /DNA_ORIENTATION=+